MEKFEKLLQDYFKFPYQPEYLAIKVREEVKDYLFSLIKEESADKVIKKN